MSNLHASPVIAVAATALAACAPNQEFQTSASALNAEPAVTVGMSIEELHHAVGRYVHQFTVTRAAQTVRCVSAPVSKDRWSFYLVFVEDRLANIVERPQIHFEIVVVDGRRMGRRTVKLDDDVESVLHAPELSSGEAMEIAGERARHSRETQERYSEPLPIPLFLWELGEALNGPRLEQEKDKHRKLLKQFDPLKVELGMSPDQVAETFTSKCVGERRVGESVIRFYGEAGEVSTIRDPWVAVRFEDDLVIAIYSADFFDPRWRDS